MGCCSLQAHNLRDQEVTPEPMQQPQSFISQSNDQSVIEVEQKNNDLEPPYNEQQSPISKQKRKKGKRRKHHKSQKQPIRQQSKHKGTIPPNSVIKVNRGNFIAISQKPLLDCYSLQGKLGDGSFGAVYRAVNKDSQVERAVKSIPKRKIGDQKDKLLQEVEILRALDHPNIIKVQEVLEDKHYIHIVTEICHGGELFNRIVASRHFSENKAAAYMYQLMSAITYCHRAGIVHRDLKPENLLLENDRDDALLKVIDFGESMKVSPKDIMTKRTGTAYYIAPEVLQGKYNDRCDVWSCGVILFVMLSGKPPFNGPNDRVIFNKIIRGTYNFSGLEWVNISQDAKNLINKMLTLNPAQRPSAEVILQDNWIQSRQQASMADRNIAIQTFQNLSKYQVGHKLQNAALELIASQMVDNKETENFRRLFLMLDRDGDGQITKQELQFGFQQLNIQNVLSFEAIMQRIDSDGSGCIDFTEFLAACMDWGKVLTEDKLRQAFKFVDKDNSGNITTQELREFFGIEEQDSEWDQIIAQIDKNGDGEIDFDEFKQIMQKIGEINS